MHDHPVRRLTLKVTGPPRWRRPKIKARTGGSGWP